jgi:hypothetical protein
MKGHVGGGSGSRRLSGVGYSVKAKPVHVSYYISTRICDVQEQAPENAGSVRAFHLDRVGHKLESLIMAQNERWRHA